MKIGMSTALLAGAALCVAAGAGTRAQGTLGSPESHRAAAATAARQDFRGVLRSVCPAPQPPAAAPAASAAPAGRGQAAAVRQTPPREEWYAEPVKVFDNFYFIGTRNHGAWAVQSPEGLIAIDALYDYAVIDAVEGGLKKLGLNPVDMKYLVITHGHGDHHGGTRYLQDKYRPQVVMGPADWDLVAKDTRNPRPTRDVEARDGQTIRVGDAAVTVHITPGHTPTTLSLLVPVKDGARTHVAAQWGGTAFSAATSTEALRNYVASAVRFRGLAAKAGADVIFTNHTAFDGTLEKLAALARRQPGAPHPFVVGAAAVDRYLTVVEECAKAELAGRR
jgi:metallo-beta-lactamase class B